MLHLSSLVLKINRNKQNLFSEIISSHGGKVKRILIIAITKKKKGSKLSEQSETKLINGYDFFKQRK